MVFSGPSAGKIIPTVISQSQYPLYDVAATVVDLRLWASNEPKEFTIDSIRRWTEASQAIFSIGNMSAKSVWGGPSAIPIPFSPDDEEFRISFTARNGFWDEDLIYRGQLGHRKRALRVRSSGEKPIKVLREIVDEGFPREPDGSIAWPK
jgi:hypothetical protein